MEGFWLSNNMSWAEVQKISREKGIDYPTFTELAPSIPIGVALICAQVFVQNGLFNRLAVAFGVVPWDGKDSPQNRKLLTKFSESLWKLLCYSGLCIYGATTLFNKEWIWNTMEYFEDIPFQNVDSDIKNYYLVELGLYISLSVTQLSGPKRKDFRMLVIHHFATIGLLLLSWGSNAVRVGSAILLCHDVADVPLELTKLGIYTKAEWLKNSSFLLFTATWFVTRLGLYPFYIVRSAWEHWDRTEAPSTADSLCLALLVLLIFLHVGWTYFILKMIAKVVIFSEVEDTRSSDDEDDDDHNSNELRKHKRK